jgi:ribosome maturation factor RimP
MSNSQLAQMIAPAVAALGYELWHLELSNQGRHKLLRILVEGESGVTSDALGKITKQVSALLDVEDPISGRYTLEVSSPGMDRPLVKPDHYQRVIGQRVKLRLRMPLAQTRVFEGALVAMDGEQVTLALPEGEQGFDLSDIEKANVVPEFK